ncbi:hypothetical protein JHK87_037542 [Glycine soja]|nr:hypothetical protein JHK87_037542 [Glycine soja]
MDSTSNERARDLFMGFSIFTEPMKTEIIEHARSAMEELLKIGTAGHLLWKPQPKDRYDILNQIEYMRQFGQVDSTLNSPTFATYQTEQPASMETPTVALQTEASRDMAFINMSPISIVELLMDVNEWSSAFYNIVSKATIVGTLLGAQGSYNDKLHVMSAELHLPTTTVPIREYYFGRYSKKFSHNIWGIVDISLEKFIPSPTSNFLKRPSGCLISGMANGHSKVAWVEHVEADHSHLDNYFKPLVASTLAFGASRWLNSLNRYGEWLQTLRATTFVADEGVLIPQTGRTSFLKLGDRMMKTFCANVSATADNPWMKITTFHGDSDVKVMIKNNVEDTAMPPGTSAVFTTSGWLEVSPNRLFNFLRHENSRTKWDMLSHRLVIRKVASIPKGENPGNCVSLLRANTSQGKLQIFYLQESYTDSTGSYVVYAPLDESAITAIVKGTNPDRVMILPSGFSILPGRLQGDEDRGTGSLLTVAFHVFESVTNKSHILPEYIHTMRKVITDTVTSIKDIVQYHNRPNNWMEDSDFLVRF